MENHIRSLETNLVHANEEISNLRTKVNPDDDYMQTDNTYDIIDTMVFYFFCICYAVPWTRRENPIA